MGRRNSNPSVNKQSGEPTNAEAAETNNVIVTSVVYVSVLPTSDGLSYSVKFKDTFKGYSKVNDEYVEQDIDTVQFPARALIAQCISCVEGLSTLYTRLKEKGIRKNGVSAFGAAELDIVLRNAEVTIVREHFLNGEEYTTASGEILTHEHDGYNTKITEIKVSDSIREQLNKLNSLEGLFN